MSLAPPAGRPGPRVVTAMYALGAVMGLILATTTSLNLRFSLRRPGQKLLSAELYDQIQMTILINLVITVGLPALAAMSNQVIPRVLAAPPARRPLIMSATLYVIGAASLIAPVGSPESDGGWFNVSSNAGVLFMPGSRLSEFGAMVACIGLTMTAAIFVREAIAHEDGRWVIRSNRTAPRVLVTSQLVVLVVAPLLAALQLVRLFQR